MQFSGLAVITPAPLYLSSQPQLLRACWENKNSRYLNAFTKKNSRQGETTVSLKAINNL